MRHLLTHLRFFFAPKPHREVEEELAFHLEQLTQAHVDSGAEPREARRQALIELGGIHAPRAQAHEQRPTHLLETIAQDMRFGLRSLRRNRACSLTILLTLMLGIGATTAVFSVVDRILFRSLPYADADRLVSIGLDAPIEPDEFMLSSSYYVWQENQRPFVALTSETGAAPCDLTEERPSRLSCAHVEANFLPTLGVAMALGRNFTPAEDTPSGPKVMLISHALWRSRFAANPVAVGSMLHLDGHPYEIIGVLPANFELPRLQKADVLLPEALDSAAERRALPGRPMWAFGRLRRGVSLDQARAQLQPLFEFSLKGAPPQFQQEVHLKARSLRDRQMQDVRTAAWILFVLALSVLLIACANVASLALARQTQRLRETAVRAALGASRGRLVQQAITESLLLAFAGMLLGLALAGALLRFFQLLAPAALPFLSKASLDGRILLFALGATLLTVLLSGAGPALSQPGPRVLSGRGNGSVDHARARRWLVAGQLAASMVLLVVSALLTRSFSLLESQSLGFQARNIVTLTLSLGQNAYPTPASRLAFFHRLESNLRYGPGVTGLALSDSVPPGGDHHDQLFAALGVVPREPFTKGTGGTVAWRWISPDYFHLLHIPLLRGRGFTEDERSSNRHFIVLSRSLAARLFPSEDPIGRQMHLAGDAPETRNPLYTVTGVVQDVKNAGLAATDEPEYYLLRRDQPEDWNEAATIFLETSLPAGTVEPWLQSQMTALDPALPVRISTLTANVAELADQPRFETLLVSLFAAIGLALAMVGLYGVIAYLVAQRTQEIGVRMALGASRADILMVFVLSGLRMLVPGLLSGLVLSLLLSRVLASVLFHVSAHDPAALLAAAGLLALIAAVATTIPSLGATRVEPAVALRSE